MGNIVSSILGGGSTGGLDYKPQGLNQDQVNQTFTDQQNALAQQQAFVKALQAQNGIQNQNNVFNQLQGVANGTGPNPAQAMLNNATGQNVANQAALMAGQRGAGANAGLIARQAAQQGATTQQQAAGQGAALQANQSLNAMNAMGNIAGQQVQNQGQATQAYNNAALQGEQNAIGSMNNQNQVNSALAQQAAQEQANVIGGLMGGIGSVLTTAPAAGSVLGGLFGSGGAAAAGGGGGVAAAAMAEGGKIEAKGPSSKVGQHFHKKVPALVSPGERYLSPKAVKEVQQGKNPMKAGEKIPGKPVVGGAKNSYANDIVPKTLESGGIVLPRSVTQSKDPSEAAAKFVAAVMAKKGKR